MSIERQSFPQFFITTPVPCPYLAGRMERKVFTHLVGADARKLNNHLSHGGFRRSQNIAYRPSCDGCSACVSVRVRVNDFAPNRSGRRNLKRNSDLAGDIKPSLATSEQYSVFRGYIDSRHSDGGMMDMSVLDYAAMVDDSVVGTQIVEYRHRLTQTLVAAMLIDVLDDGLSLIYSFYEPDEAARGLGTFMILDQIDRARRMGLPYAYLGYWVEGSPKMQYKAGFLPQERLGPQGWMLIQHQGDGDQTPVS